MMNRKTLQLQTKIIILLSLIIFAGTISFGEDAPDVIKNLSNALNKYEEDVGTYPSTNQGLSALVKRPVTVNPEDWKGPYINEIPSDPWGHEYIYVFPGKHGENFDLYSLGPDKIKDTEDDVVSWDKKKAERAELLKILKNSRPELDPRKDYVEEAGGLDYEMIWIKPGSFLFGSHQGRFGAPSVTLDGYWIGKYEVTARQYCIFLNAIDDPEGLGYISIIPGSTITKKDGRYVSRPGCEDKPAYPISWMGAEAFCRMLSAGTGFNYQLPTEAQWERAARAGQKLKNFPWGNDDASGKANLGRSGQRECDLLTPVGKFPANDFGLHDVTGNVMEWTRDWWSEADKLDSRLNPRGPYYGIEKVLKGGNMFTHPHFARIGARFSNYPWYKAGGFRMVRDP
mgnify:CR=1 FL=1